MPPAQDEVQGHRGTSSTSTEMSILSPWLTSSGPNETEYKACSSPGDFFLEEGTWKHRGLWRVKSSHHPDRQLGVTANVCRVPGTEQLLSRNGTSHEPRLLTFCLS